MENRRIKNLHLMNFILIILLVILVLNSMAKLPARIPVHFGMDGTPDRWAGKGNLYIFLAAAVGLTMMFYAFIIFLPWFRKHPKLLSFPTGQKEKFLDLPAEVQQVYWDVVVEYLAATCVSVNIIWLAVTWGTIQVALEKSKTLPGWTLWGTLGLMAVMNFYYLPKIIRMPKKLISEHSPDIVS